MFERITGLSIQQRWQVMRAVAAMAVVGVLSHQKPPIDAVPDITNVQVQIYTPAPAYSPLEVAQRVTFRIEMAMAGLPHPEQTRSLSRYGLSQITVVLTTAPVLVILAAPWPPGWAANSFQSQRGRRRDPGLAHSRHQPDPVAGAAKTVGTGLEVGPQHVAVAGAGATRGDHQRVV